MVIYRTMTAVDSRCPQGVTVTNLPRKKRIDKLSDESLRKVSFDRREIYIVLFSVCFCG